MLRERREDTVAAIVAEEESIKEVEGELADERKQLQLERDAFKERQDKLLSQQVE